MTSTNKLMGHLDCIDDETAMSIEIDELKAENERLRGLLKKANIVDEYCLSGQCQCDNHSSKTSDV